MDQRRIARIESRWPLEENNPVAALSEMMDMIDASPKTVVAALNGPALGGGGDSWMLREELKEFPASVSVKNGWFFRV